MSKFAKKIIVNAITLSRLVASLVLPFIFDRIEFWLFIVLLGCAFLTDFIDGRLSRKWEVQTVGGAILDPLGDKFLAFSCLLSLARWSKGMWILFGLELTIGIITCFRVLSGENTKASKVGKIKTWILSLLLSFEVILLFAPNLLNSVVGIIGIETVSLTMKESFVDWWSGFTVGWESITIVIYIYDAWHNRDRVFREKRKIKSAKEICKRLFDEKQYSVDKDKPLAELIAD